MSTVCLRRDGRGELILMATDEARAAKPLEGGEWRLDESAGLDLLDRSNSRIAFGRYRGRTFKWILENDLGWAVSTAASIDTGKSRARNTPTDEWLNKNRQEFLSYTLSLQEVQPLVRRRKAADVARARAADTGDIGQKLVGFGKYADLTLEALCSSSIREHQKYVRDFILKKTDVRPGTCMDVLQEYAKKYVAEGGRSSQPVAGTSSTHPVPSGTPAASTSGVSPSSHLPSQQQMPPQPLVPSTGQPIVSAESPSSGPGKISVT